jgi:Vacuolar protein sorting-associated protein 26
VYKCNLTKGGLISNPIVLFIVSVRELDVPGEIYEKKTYPFEFASVEMPYESYNGTNVRLRFVSFLLSVGQWHTMTPCEAISLQASQFFFTSWQVHLTGDNKSQLCQQYYGAP